MRAAFYDRQGPAREVLQVGDMPVPEPGPGEVRVRVAVSGIHVSDLGKRRGWSASTMAHPRVIPHSDGAGVIDAVGPQVDPGRIGERVWVFLAQSCRPFGTAAEYVAVPSEHAVLLPEKVPLEQGALLGITGITGHRAIFTDGPVRGQSIVVTGAAGAVGRAAVAVARRGGATVIGTVRQAGQVEQALAAGAHHVANVAGLDAGAAARQILAIAPVGVDRVAEVAFDTGIAVDVEILKIGGVVTGYATGKPEPPVPFWALCSKNITVRFLGDDDFPEEANRAAAADLTEAMAAGDLLYPIAGRYPLEQIADAHEAAEQAGATGRIVIDL